jgi:nuclear cap-binding protein subunit 1
VYYFALITDLCKLSPQTVGPAVGKSFRKLYSFLGEGLDVEVARRFAEWFASHMSNFGFNWVWKEWYVQDAPTWDTRVILTSAHEQDTGS